MIKKYYVNRRGPIYYKEKSIIEKISEKRLPSYIEDLKKRCKDTGGGPLDFFMLKSERELKILRLMGINNKIKSIKNDPNNRQFFGLFQKTTPELDDLEREKWTIEEDLKKTQSAFSDGQYTDRILGDMYAALEVAEKRLAKIISQRKKAEALKQKTSIIAEYEGKSRKVARSVKTRLPMNPTCPYCGAKIGEEPHADHIYPISKGGRSTIANMVYICTTCNTNKSNMTLREFISKFNLNRDMIEKNLESLGKSF